MYINASEPRAVYSLIPTNCSVCSTGFNISSHGVGIVSPSLWKGFCLIRSVLLWDKVQFLVTASTMETHSAPARLLEVYNKQKSKVSFSELVSCLLGGQTLFAEGLNCRETQWDENMGANACKELFSAWYCTSNKTNRHLLTCQAQRLFCLLFGSLYSLEANCFSFSTCAR